MVNNKKEFSVNDLSDVQHEHYLVGQTFSNTFNAEQFRAKYLEIYPSRNPTSILPSDFAYNNNQKAKESYPSFLERLDRATYRYIGLNVGHHNKARNPTWTRDELILALDLYFREPAARGSKTHPAVIELSETLNTLPIRPPAELGTYRNPNGVGLKLSNFLKFDPEYSGAGMEHSGKLDGEIWDEFANDRNRLNLVAEAIKANSQTQLLPEVMEPGNDDMEAAEGRLLTSVHLIRERKPILVTKKKSKVLADTKKLECEACGFDFHKVYGSIGYGFAECHHTKPVSSLLPNEKTKLSDLAILCSNCHRMIHRSKPWLSVADLKSKISNE